MIESPRHELDQAIDRVAAKLVEVPADAQLLSRTIAQLPERSATPWFLTLPAQVTTAAALVLLAIVYTSSPRERPAELRMATVPASPAEAPTLEVAARPVAAAIRDPLAPIADPALPRSDHEHSLAPVEPLRALAFESLAPVALDPDAAVALAPLVMTELTIADEPSPREQE